MAINITMNDNPSTEQIHVSVKDPVKEETNFSMTLKARRRLDGAIMIMDHPDMDVIVIGEKMKILALSKDTMSDKVYASQSRLFDYLCKRGVVLPESVQGGNVYGSLEATIAPPSKTMNVDEVSTFLIGKFILEEKPSHDFQKALEDEYEDRLMNPSDEDSTNLGEIPQSDKKGSLTPGQVRRYIAGY